MTDLIGCCVWITRPAAQAEPWAQAVEAAGGRALREPLLDIRPPVDTDAAATALAAAESAELVIAISRNAVDHAWRIRPGFAPSGHLFAVGPGTAEALRQRCGRPVACPAGTAASEGLLAMPGLANPAGRRVAILAGEGGRTLLADELDRRGACVQSLALYRRVPAVIEVERLEALLAAANAVVVTSSEALTSLLAMADPEQTARLERLQLVAPSRRVVQQAHHGLNWTAPPLIIKRMCAAHVIAALAQVWPGHRQ